MVQGVEKLWPVKVWVSKSGVTPVQVESGQVRFAYKLASNPKCQIFFGPSTLTGHTFADPWAMIINSSSLESPKPYIYLHWT